MPFDIIDFDRYTARRQANLREGRAAHDDGKPTSKPFPEWCPIGGYRQTATATAPVIKTDPDRVDGLDARQRAEDARDRRIEDRRPIPAVCWHEAAHAVAGHAYARQIESVTVHLASGSGRVKSFARAGQGSYADAVILAAGPTAEMSCGGSTFAAAWGAGRTCDGVAKDWTAFEAVTGGDETTMQLAMADADKVIRTKSRQLKAVAAALRDRGSLTGREVVAIVESF